MTLLPDIHLVATKSCRL